VKYKTADSFAVTLEEGKSYKAANSSGLLATSGSKSPTLANSGQAAGGHSFTEVEVLNAGGAGAGVH
jgi:hypothetical protein